MCVTESKNETVERRKGEKALEYHLMANIWGQRRSARVAQECETNVAKGRARNNFFIMARHKPHITTYLRHLICWYFSLLDALFLRPRTDYDVTVVPFIDFRVCASWLFFHGRPAFASSCLSVTVCIMSPDWKQNEWLSERRFISGDGNNSLIKFPNWVTRRGESSSLSLRFDKWIFSNF